MTTNILRSLDDRTTDGYGYIQKRSDNQKVQSQGPYEIDPKLSIASGHHSNIESNVLR